MPIDMHFHTHLYALDHVQGICVGQEMGMVELALQSVGEGEPASPTTSQT